MVQEKRTADAMFPVVEEYIESELAQKDFSAENGMSVAVLNYWLAKYRRKSAESDPMLK